MAKNTKVKKEEVKVVDEVIIETVAEEIVEEAPVEEVVEEVIVETPVVEAPKEVKTEGKGKVVKLTQKSATFEDGTVIKIVGQKQHSELRKLR